MIEFLQFGDFYMRFFFGFIALGAFIVFSPRLLTGINSWPHLYSVESAPPKRVAIVFGAGLRRDGSPTAVLRDRVETAAELYFAGKVEKLLMSGDNQTEYYNEPSAMRQYAISLGVASEDIILDYAGHRTYDTCFRARDIFRLSEAILITQGFHLPRALYTCRVLGVDAVGVSADRRTYRPPSRTLWNMRETGATVVAFIDLYLTRPKPILGDPEPIFPGEVQ